MIVNDSGLVCPSERSCNACAGAQSARTVIFKRLIPAKRRRTDTGPIYGYNCALSHLIGKLRISNPDRCFSSEFGFNAAFSPKSVKGCSKYFLHPAAVYTSSWLRMRPWYFLIERNRMKITYKCKIWLVKLVIVKPSFSEACSRMWWTCTYKMQTTIQHIEAWHELNSLILVVLKLPAGVKVHTVFGLLRVAQ